LAWPEHSEKYGGDASLKILWVKTTEPTEKQHDTYCTNGTNLSEFDLKVDHVHDVTV